jgi:hypothetical protein
VACIHSCRAACRGACALVVLEERHGLFDGRAREDLVRDRLLLGDHAGELLDAPLVGLVEVDLRSEEAARVQRVQLATDASSSDAAGASSVRRKFASSSYATRAAPGVPETSRARRELSLRRGGVGANVAKKPLSAV